MSTLPFLLSVADELDNINSQSYMDDFGLGFHPHRQYYRSPTIQLSLPASTDWMQEQRQRCRTHKFVDETPNQNLPEDEDEEDKYAAERQAGNVGAAKYGGGHDRSGASTSAAGSSSRQKYTSALNSNTDTEDNVDNSVEMYNLSKKCCKNYHRQQSECTAAAEDVASAVPTPPTPAKEKANVGGGGGYRLHTKCMEGNNSSSEESLQKVSSSIEFLTCFLLKKTRASKSSQAATTGGSGKKS